MNVELILRQATGLNLSKTSIDRAIRQRMVHRGIVDKKQYLQHIQTDEMTALIELLVVTESWLFRDAEAFAAATAFVKEQSSILNRPIHILSIPCANGEEPYSMAMALHAAEIPKNLATIDAIDLSAEAIARAQAGIFGNNAFRGNDLDFRERFFERHGDRYRLFDHIRERVHFKRGSILELDVVRYSKYYDVIFCRNLMIYFDRPTSTAAIARLHAVMTDNGMLFSGYSEVPVFCQNQFEPVRYPLAFALRKKKLAAIKPGKIPARHGAVSKSTPPSAPVATVNEQLPPRHKQESHATPSNPATLLEQARTLADKGNFEEAGLKCKSYLSIAPDSAEAYFILGIASERINRMDDAEAHWSKCIYLEPNHYEALCHLALLAEQRGDSARAASLKERAKRIFERQQQR